jgi:hypothetical protein
VATDPPADLELAPLNGPPRSLRELLTTFHLVFVALDPYTHESGWIIDTAARIFRVYDDADCRVAWLVAGEAGEAREFLGPWADEILTFADPERAAIKAFGLERLPALVHVRQDLSVAGVAEGWDPNAWRKVTDNLSAVMHWTRPPIPAPGDPAPYQGVPA